eukprot:gene7875-10690_t
MSDQLSAQSNIFMIGLLDSLSIHRTLPILVNNGQIAKLTFLILGANTFLLLGSIFVFHRGINPIFDLINSPPQDEVLASITTAAIDQLDGTSQSSSVKMLWILYQSFWLYPICILCYVCSMFWYQDLADLVHKHLMRDPNKTPLAKSVGGAMYGTLVWLFLFIQVQLLTVASPILFNHAISILDIFFRGLQADDVNSYVINAVGKYGGLYILQFFALVTQLFGLTMMSLLYGWYGFDPEWISSGMGPDQRFRILEKHWAYFVGFGFPYVVLMKTTSFFVGYGSFLALFPFCIMLGSISCTSVDINGTQIY